MNANHLAIIFYGMLTIALSFVQALVMDSPVGMLAAVVAAGLTYVFQAWFEVTPRVTVGQAFLWALIIIATIFSMGAPHVLR